MNTELSKHSILIESTWRRTKIFMDGVELNNFISVSFPNQPLDMPVVKRELGAILIQKESITLDGNVTIVDKSQEQGR